MSLLKEEIFIRKRLETIRTRQQRCKLFISSNKDKDMYCHYSQWNPFNDTKVVIKYESALDLIQGRDSCYWYCNPLPLRVS